MTAGFRGRNKRAYLKKVGNLPAFFALHIVVVPSTGHRAPVLSPPMSIEDLQGRAYERSFRADRSTAAAFVEATGDDLDRWSSVAPPSFAGAALFAVAPSFLYDPDVGDFSKVLIHADQTFRWRAPWTLDADYIVTGSVDRVRMRGGSAWVTFGAVVTCDDDTVLESLSTFIMSDQRPAVEVVKRDEPAPKERSPEVRPESFRAAESCRRLSVRQAGPISSSTPQPAVTSIRFTGITRLLSTRASRASWSTGC